MSVEHISGEKEYNFVETEKKWYKIWQENRLVEDCCEPAQHSFSMILPPANVSGSFHLGHALTFTTADIIARRKKMQGFNILWLQGTEHAETPAPVVVETPGIALDWSSKQFTSGSKMKKVVCEAFVQLFNEGKIYRSVLSDFKPNISNQWFLRTADIAKSAVEAVLQGEIHFIPEKWEKAYLNWMSGIQDWCISSQQQGGQRLPVYCCQECGNLMVEEHRPEECQLCASSRVLQDEGTLDTWFFSALWPLSSLGCLDKCRDSVNFYPANLVVTGLDGIFLSVASMIMLGIHFGKDVPFREVLINSQVRDTLNTIEIIQDYGTDVLRFTLAVQAVPGMDISLSLNRLKGHRAFVNKIWHASRYVLLNLDGYEDFDIDLDNIATADKWILHFLNNIIDKVNDLVDHYRIYEAAGILYHFFWHEYCDWYLEFSKCDTHNPNTRKVLKLTLFRLLQMLHPFMPFVSEEIYQKIKSHEEFLIQTEFPSMNSQFVFNDEFSHIELLKKVIRETRRVRTENRIDPNLRINIFLKTESEKEKAIVRRELKYFDFLTRSAETEIVNDFSGLEKGFRGSYLNWEILLPFDNDQDRLKELARLKNEHKKLENLTANIEKKLDNEDFINKASQAVVTRLKKKLQAAIDRKEKIHKTIGDLS